MTQRWVVTKASNWEYEEVRFISNERELMQLLLELYEDYGKELVINFDRHLIIIYNYYIE